MSKYTTGELAKLCDVSVRTVQYYDTRGIWVPSNMYVLRQKAVLHRNLR